ncbi:unnamed protein product [Porites evermanni]|uniref:Transposase Tc1-like domain-containing protein n=1 Tax=Porites evermanni TaxID=104178 RepID=A0ABN8SIU2_9CNID|nr:unnamed protein product [Porites evermanni]
MSLADLVDESFIRELVEREFSYKSISERLRILFPESRGLSARSVRRFCKDRNINVTSLQWISDEHLEEMVSTNILQVKLNFVNCIKCRCPIISIYKPIKHLNEAYILNEKYNDSLNATICFSFQYGHTYRRRMM